MTIITLADAKTHLNVGSSDTSHDAEIQTFVDAATPAIERIVGAVDATQYTEVHDGGLSYILLRHRPVLAVSSVTEYRGHVAYPLTSIADPSASSTSYSYTVELDTGRIIRRSSGSESAFPRGRGSVVVTYTAGRSVVPANVRLGALELVRHWYQQTQQGGRPSFPSSAAAEDLTATMPLGVPRRVLELLESHRRAPSVA